MEKKTLGSFLAALRKANGMTQRELAERLNVSDKTVSRWERDDGDPELALIPVLAEIFGVTCDELLRGERLSPEMRSSEPEPNISSARGEKQRQRLLKKSMTQYKNRSCIAAGLCVGGIIAGLICNLVFLRASLGFFLGAAFLAAAAICQKIFVNHAFLSVEDSELNPETLSAWRRQVIQLAQRVLGLDAACLGFLLPLAPIDAYLGLDTSSLVLLGTIGALVGLLLYNIVLYFYNARLLAREEYRLPPEAELRWRKNHRLKGACALTLLGVWVVTFAVHMAMTSLTGPTSIMKGRTFDDYDSFIAFMEQELEAEVPEGQAIAPQAIAPYESWYDEYGNEISEEQARTHQLTDKNGNVVCQYVQRNESVVSLSYAPKEDTILPITVYTQADRRAAEQKASLRHGIFAMVYCIELAGALAVYFKKRVGK